MALNVVCRRCMHSYTRLAAPAPSSTAASTHASSSSSSRAPFMPAMNHIHNQRHRELVRGSLQTAALISGAKPEHVLDRDQLDRLGYSRASSSTSTPAGASASASAEGSSSTSSLQSAEPASPGSAGPPTTPPTIPETPTLYEIPPLEDPLLGFLTNLLMKDGKKATARKHVSLILSTLRNRSSQDPLPLLREAFQKAAPSVRMAQQRSRGKSVQVPLALGERQRVHRAITWIVEASDKRKNVNSGGSKKLGERFAFEVEAVLNDTSDVLKRKEQLHQMATVNRANVKSR